MANRRAPVTQAEVTRYIKAASNAAVPVGRVVIAPDGTVTIYPVHSAELQDDPNPWDQP